MKTWLLGTLGAIITGVVVYWLTDGLRHSTSIPPTGAGDGGSKAHYRMSENEVGIDRWGGDYKDLQVGGLDECRQTCLDESTCLAFTYNIAARQCWLKSSVPLRQSNTAFISGVKVQEY